MKKVLLFILFVFPLLIFSQNERVKILRAEVVADSIQVERVTVTNVSAGTFTITNDLGQFSIFAMQSIIGIFLPPYELKITANQFVTTENCAIVKRSISKG